MLKRIKEILKNKTFRWLTMISLLIIIVFLFQHLFISTKDYKEESLDNFINLIKNDISKDITGDVEIYEVSRVIKYTYKNNNFFVRYPGSTYLSHNASPQILDDLGKSHLSYKFKSEPISIFDIMMKIASFLPLIFFIFIGYLLMKQMGMINSFPINKAEKTNVTFADIAGYESVKRQLIEYVDYLNNPIEFENVGVTPTKGILLVGPPGCGKTLFAQAVSTESHTPFFYLSGADIEDKYIGSGAKNVAELFKAARKASEETGKAIIFVDEIDSVGYSRSLRTVPETNQTINKILTELDGFKEDNKILVFAATNLLESLDPALIRSGRFDQIIHIGLPNFNERKLIIELYLNKKGNKVHEDVYKENYSNVMAQQTEGFCNADFKNMINEASKYAKRDGKEKIDIECLRKSYTKLVAGLEKEHNISEEELKIIAYHEAGHAIGQIMTNPNGIQSVAYITITPYGESLGHVSGVNGNKVLFKKSDLRNQIKMVLSGRAVEEKILQGDFTSGASSDLRKANKLVEEYIFKYGMTDDIQNIFIEKLDPNSEHAHKIISTILKELYHETKDLIYKHYDMIEVIAEYLLKHQNIDQHQLENILLNTSYNLKNNCLK
jgi:cell division protease FtsH